MTVELCASSRNAVPADEVNDVTACVSVLVEGAGGHPVDVVCVLDTSGSMDGAMGLVQESMKKTIRTLGAGDRLSIVSFASRAQVKLPLTAMDGMGREAAQKEIKKIRANGGTDIEGALHQAFSVVSTSEPCKAAAAVVIFFTDGLPTSGSVRDRQGLLDIAKGCFVKAHDSHYKSVSLFALGFGTDHDAHFLYELANYGKGCYSYISSDKEIAPNLKACFDFSTNIVACDVQLAVTPCDGCVVKKVHSRYDINGTTVMLSDINKNQERYILVDLTVPKDVGADETSAATAHVSYYDVAQGAYEDVRLDVTIPRNTCTDVDPNVEVHKMRLLAAYALERAGSLCEQGQVAEAANLIRGTSKVIRDSSVGDDDECVGLLEDLSLCEHGLHHTSGLLSVASNVGYGRVGSAKHHNVPTPAQAEGGEKEGLLTARYVTPAMVISHEGEQYRVLKNTLSKAGKHGNPKVLLEVLHVKTGQPKSLVFSSVATITRV